MPRSSAPVLGSFRDPSGFVFVRDGVLYRQVNRVYQEHYDQLMHGGLYDELVGAGLLVAHEETGLEAVRGDGAYKVLKPCRVPFISYPYEWCFSQLKDAARATLEIQRRALARGMTLKDASAYNIQFLQGRPVLIDTLSFETCRPGAPWVAYRQFCKHFLAPLALMAYRDVRLGCLLRLYMDGLPLDLASRLLPGRTWLRFSLLAHIHLHAWFKKRYGGQMLNVRERTMSPVGVRALVDNLASSVRRLRWRPNGSQWADYYEDTNYSPRGLEHKKQVVADLLRRTGDGVVWDLGANIGDFSRIASAMGRPTISYDMDPACVERSYLDCVARGETRILPLVLDLANPSPSIGWATRERLSVFERGPASTVLALALLHHLAISNNVPLGSVADLLAGACRHLIIEFVPKSDSQVARLLVSREDIFPDYTEEGFLRAFATRFEVEHSVKIEDSERTVYLMRTRQGAS